MFQVLPLGCAENAGLDGAFRLLRLKDGTTIALNEIQLRSRVISNARDVQLLDIRYGAIRAQALPPREFLTFIENLLGETDLQAVRRRRFRPGVVQERLQLG